MELRSSQASFLFEIRTLPFIRSPFSPPFYDFLGKERKKSERTQSCEHRRQYGNYYADDQGAPFFWRALLPTRSSPSLRQAETP